MSYTLAVADGDLDINAVGTTDLVQGRDKLSQDLAEILLSDYDAERDYGGKLQTMSVTGPGAKALVSSELQAITNRLKAMQSQDKTATVSERIASVPGIDVQQLQSTDFVFRIRVRTADANTVAVQDVLKYRPTSLAHIWPNGVSPFN